MLILAALLSAAAPVAKPPAKGTPPITAQTRRSGGPRPAEQLALSFDHADLSFEVLPARYRIEGDATLTFTARGPLTRLLIDLDRNLPVRGIAIDGVDLPKSAWANPEGQLVITLPRPAAAGDRIVARIRYGGQPHVAVNAPWDDGIVWSKTSDGRPWIATTSEGYGCDLFWPCLDFPTGEPKTATLHIVVPKGLKAPSNGRLLGVDTLPDGRARWNWQARQPNTYGIALNIGPYEELRGDYRSRFGNVIPMHYWYLPGNRANAEGLFAEFAPMLDFFESTVGPYPFGDEKMGVIETPHKGMEHQTINAYGNEYAKAPEGFDWLLHHELAHEWFANQMTAANWDDYWLHEGFASYMQPLYGRWREGDARYAVMLEAQRNRIANRAPVVTGRVLTEEEVYEPTLGGAGVDVYFKGSWLLHTLRWLVGDEAFGEAMRRLVYGRPDPKPGNFTPRYAATRDFEVAVREATGRDYGWLFDAYLRRAALPVLDTTRNGDRLTLSWRGPDRFPMPVEVRVGDALRRIEMADGRGEVKVPSGAHVTIDPFARVLKANPAVDAYQAGLERR